MQLSERQDPIRKKFFDLIEKIDKISIRLFFLCGLLSVSAAYLGDTNLRSFVPILQGIFLTASLCLFGLDLWVKLSLSPNAADARSTDFMASAFNQPLCSTRTSGYYNNAVGPGMQKIAAQVFENTFFTKEICYGMLRVEVPIAIIYLVFWIGALVLGGLSISIVGVLAQVLFSEQVGARILRLFWLSRKCESIHETMRTLFLSRATGDYFNAAALNSFTRYEVSKAIAGITLSSKVFDKLNQDLSLQWINLSQECGVPQNQM